MTDQNDRDTLTEDEERRFADLFNQPNRMTLNPGWDDALRNAIREANALPLLESRDDTGETEAADGEGDGDGAAPVIDLATERARRAQPIWFAAAAAVLVVVGLAAVVLNRSGTDTVPLEEIATLSPSREIGTPSFTRIEAPAGTAQLATVDAGVAALVEDEENHQTTVLLSEDGSQWSTLSTLPIVDPVFASTDGSWAVVGSRQGQRIEHPGIPGTFVSTGITVFTSTNGIEWVELDLPIAPHAADTEEASVTSVDRVVAARRGDTVVISYDAIPVTDLTSLARERGLVGPDDTVVSVQATSSTFVPFATGPDTFGEIELTAEDLGWDRNTHDALVLQLFGGETRFVASVDGAPFETIPGFEDEFQVGLFLRVDEAGFSYLVATGLDFTTFRSSDGVTWTESDQDRGLIDVDERWQVTQPGFDPTGRDIEQSLDGGPFRPIPVPPGGDVNSTSFTTTEFGGAVLWEDERVPFRLDGTLERDGFTIDFVGNGNFTVTAPDGEVLADNQSTARVPDGRVVVDHSGFLQVFDESGERLLLLDIEDLLRNLNEVEDWRRFIGWSTDGEDWRFASFEAIGFGLWGLDTTDAGLVAIDIINFDQAVFIDWPEEVIGG